MLQRLSGYKTYIVAVGGVVVAVLGYLGVKLEPELQDTLITVIACVLAILLRSGIKKAETPK